MITAVCANPCIDETILVEEMTLGIVNRALEKRTDASGKGINVAIVHKRLGGESVCIGYNYARRGDLIRNRLLADAVPFDFVDCGGEVRSNYKIINRSDGKMTEVNEKGGEVSAQQRQALLNKCAAYAKKSKMVTFSGSLPAGCDDYFYRDLILACGDTPCVLDTEGRKFGCGLEAKPFMVKPNQYELSLYVGRELKTQEEILTAALSIVKKGISIVAVSMGGDGALITDGKQAYFAPVVPVEVSSTVGAGDSVVAALCLGLTQEKALKEAFAMGVAAGTACVITAGTALVQKEDYEKYLPMVQIKELKI